MPIVTRLDLPGLNFVAPLTADAQEDEENNWVTELLNRFQAIYGANFADLNNYGIISDISPSQISSTILMPSVADPSTPFIYNISPGVAVTPKGQLIAITSQQQVTIPQVNGQTYYIVAQYNLVPTKYTTIKLSEYVPTERVVDVQANLLTVYLASDYQLLPAASILNMVVIGLVTVGQDLTSTTFQLTTTLDVTQTAYAGNRPWFSPVDIQHRSTIGNPHLTTLESLDNGSIPLLEKFRTDGFIIAQDLQYPFFPGHYCQQAILNSQVSSTFPYTIPLNRRPVRLGRLYLQSDSTVEFPYTYDPVTNLITFLVQPPTPPTPTSTAYDMYIDTLVVDSLEPTLLTSVVRMNAISSTGEAAISQGENVQSITSTDIALNDFGPGAVQRARIFVMGDGTLVRTPTTLICQGRIGSDLPLDTDIPVTTAFPLPGLVRIIVRDTVNMAGQIILSETAVNGNPLTETITFSFDKTLPNGVVPPNASAEAISDTDNPSLFGLLTSADAGTGADVAINANPEFTRQVRMITLAECPCRYGVNVCSSINTIRISNFTGGTANGNLTLQVLLDTRALLPIAEVIETEQIPQSVVDNRPIFSGLTQVDRGIWAAVQDADATIGDTSTARYLENFSGPIWGDFRTTNLVNPLKSSDFALPGTIYPTNFYGSEMYYCSRLLPTYTAGNSSITPPATLNGKLIVLGSAPVLIAVSYYQMDPTTRNPTYLSTDFFTTRENLSISNSNYVHAVKIQIKGRNMNGFALTFNP